MDKKSTSQKIMITLPDELHKKLKRVAAAQQKPITRIIPKLIEDYVRDYPLDVAPKKTIGESLMDEPYVRVQDLGLTREQVDPDFNGSSTEFLEKYGHVNLRTKDEIQLREALERVSAIVVAMKEFNKVKSITKDDIKHWVKSDPAYRDQKIKDRAMKFLMALELLQPVLEDYLTE